MEKTYFKRLRDRKGSILVFFAISLVLMTAMAGLALDVTHLYGVKSQLQLAADAAALAGANALAGTSPVADATDAASKVAYLNYADARGGSAIPVTLDTSADIICGNWSGSAFTPGGTPLNAVEVIARRTNPDPNSAQPMVQNGFIKVLSRLGFDFDQTAVTARAIASIGNSGAVPIAVNEYWGQSNPTPKSYMRSHNLYPGPGRAGRTFAIFGANANDSGGASNTSSYVYLDWRNSHYNGDVNYWFSASETGTGTCSDVLTAIPAPNGNSENNVKMGPYFNYLFTGIPSGLVPPMAVFEVRNPNYNVSDNNAPNSTSTSPYATVAYLDDSGNLANLPQGPNKERFCDQWPKGSRIVVMVYDGIVTQSPSTANVVTVVGYGIIEIDGYSNGGGGGGVPGNLGTSGNTAYGHAVKITDVDPWLAGDPHLSDPYIFQPTSSAELCPTFLPALKRMIAPQVHLVDSGTDMHYGLLSSH